MNDPNEQSRNEKKETADGKSLSPEREASQQREQSYKDIEKQMSDMDPENRQFMENDRDDQANEVEFEDDEVQEVDGDYDEFSPEEDDLFDVNESWKTGAFEPSFHLPSFDLSDDDDLFDDDDDEEEDVVISEFWNSHPELRDFWCGHLTELADVVASLFRLSHLSFDDDGHLLDPGPEVSQRRAQRMKELMERSDRIRAELNERKDEMWAAKKKFMENYRKTHQAPQADEAKSKNDEVQKNDGEADADAAVK